MSWVLGFGLGLSIGSSLMTVSLTVDRKRTREALVGLVERGPFRLQTHGGQPASGADLVAALDVAVRYGGPASARNRKLVAIAGFCFALAIAATAVVLVNR